MSFVSYEQFEIEVRKCFALAEKLYNLDMSRVVYRCDIRGKNGGGWAQCRGNVHTINFSKEAVLKYWDEMVNSTIPHEVAHVVCHMKPHLGKGHNWGWKAVDRALGGNGTTRHKMELTPMHTAKPMQKYMDEFGAEWKLTHLRHVRLQRGKTIFYRYRNGGRIFKSGWINSPRPVMPVVEPVRMAARTVAQPPAKTSNRADILRNKIRDMDNPLEHIELLVKFGMDLGYKNTNGVRGFIRKYIRSIS